MPRPRPVHAYAERHEQEWAGRWWYDGRVHAAWNVGLPLVLAGALVAGLPLDGRAVAIVVVTLIVANGLEYVLHRFPMHRKMWPRMVHERHALTHHRLFDGPDREMTVFHHRDWWFILFPPWALPLVIVGTVGLGMLVAVGFGWPLARWWMAAGLGYFSAYEALHLAYHLPFTERGWLATLRQHHAAHHWRGRCATHNFNVTIPLFDVLLATRWQDESA